MKLSRCDRVWEGDALREGLLGAKEADSFQRHCRACSACASAMARDDRLRGLARELPTVAPTPLALRRVRARLLRDVVTGRPVERRGPWRRLALAAAMLAVLGSGAGVIWSRAHRGPPAGPAAFAATLAAPFAGAVTGASGAVWTQTREREVERVELTEGTVRVHVRPQLPGERFLVEMPDGELEVRGTTFEVAVAGGATSGVRVDEGTVDLRVRGSPAQRVGPGVSWTPPSLPIPDSVESARQAAEVTSARTSPPRALPPIARAPKAHAALQTDDDAPAYADAMRLFRDERYDAAATAFHAFAVSHSGASEAEDASFLEAVALAKADRPDAAALAAEHHLERYPHSFRRKEASILVARAASQRGDCGRARAVLAPWSASGADHDVEEALRTCEAGAAAP